MLVDMTNFRVGFLRSYEIRKKNSLNSIRNVLRSKLFKGVVTQRTALRLTSSEVDIKYTSVK
jgi:hypothetical protein